MCAADYRRSMPSEICRALSTQISHPRNPLSCKPSHNWSRLVSESCLLSLKPMARIRLSSSTAQNALPYTIGPSVGPRPAARANDRMAGSEKAPSGREGVRVLHATLVDPHHELGALPTREQQVLIAAGEAHAALLAAKTLCCKRSHI